MPIPASAQCRLCEGELKPGQPYNANGLGLAHAVHNDCVAARAAKRVERCLSVGQPYNGNVMRCHLRLGHDGGCDRAAGVS